MGKNGSNNGSQGQQSTGSQLGLGKTYAAFMQSLQERASALKTKIDSVENPEARRILAQTYELLIAQPVSGLASVETLFRNMEGLEALLAPELKVVRAKGVPSVRVDDGDIQIDNLSAHMPPRRVIKGVFTPESGAERPETGVIKQTTYLEYIVRFFIEHPAEERLYAVRIINDTKSEASTVRTLLNKDSLPLPVRKSEPERTRVKVTINTKGGPKEVNRLTPPQSQLYLENMIVKLPGGFSVPAQALAVWKMFPGTLDESDLYLYATHEKVSELKSAIELYDGQLVLGRPDLSGNFANRYPFLRQVLKNERLGRIFIDLIDKVQMTSEDLEKIKMFNGDQTSLYNWEHGINERSGQTAKIIYFLKKNKMLDNDNRHLINPIIQLLGERGMSFAELVNVLDKPLVRVKHALDLMTVSGTAMDSQACPYTQLPSIHTQCPSVTKLAGFFPIPERVDFMPIDMRALYLECLRHGVDGNFKTAFKQNVAGKKSPVLEAIEVSLDGRQYELRPAGIFSDGQQVVRETFLEILKGSYQKRIST